MIDFELVKTMNFSLTGVFEEDYYKQAYASPCMNWCMFTTYLLGLVGCGGLALVSWFERSGQAGPYRSLINRLVSHNMDQVMHSITFTL